MKHYAEDYKIEHNIKEEKEFEDLQRELAAESKPVEPEKPKEETNNYISRKGKVNRLANFKREAKSDGDILDVLIPGSEVIISGVVKDYYNVKYKDRKGYVKKNCITEVR